MSTRRVREEGFSEAMSFFDHPDFDDHEHVSLFSDRDSGLRAIIAIHSTVLGPAGGGCRIWKYATDDILGNRIRLKVPDAFPGFYGFNDIH
jgi:glutamate dehydrogenase/leucine dehydrogenase